MGDRLVQIIRYKGKFLAASYNHWSAGDADLYYGATENSIQSSQLLTDANATPDNAVKCLVEGITAAQNGLGSGGNISADWVLQDKVDFRKWNPYFSDVQDAFNKAHPEIPIGKDRSDGYITVDEKVASDWESWAEAINNFAKD